MTELLIFLLLFLILQQEHIKSLQDVQMVTIKAQSSTVIEKNNDDKNGSRRTTGIQRLMIRRAERFLSEVIYSSFIMYHAFVYNTHVIWDNILSNKS